MEDVSFLKICILFLRIKKRTDDRIALTMISQDRRGQWAKYHIGRKLRKVFSFVVFEIFIFFIVLKNNIKTHW